ncbi:MAG: type VI secretion system tip protein VgrG [Sphingobacteriaceae bacterium]
MSTSPVTETTDLITASVLVNGNEINTSYQILSISVNKSVNKVSSANITFLDGNPASEKFPISDSADFIPGSTVSIKAGYHSVESIIFSGIVIKHSLHARQGKAPVLIVECRDSAVKMTIGRNNAIYENSTDSDVIGKLISQHGLQKSVDSTSYQNKELIQYYCTDWDFMVSRAEVNGMIVTTDQGKVTVAKPDSSQDPVLDLTYGHTILSFEIEADARNQYTSVQASSWDMKGQSVLQVTSQDPGVTPPGNFSASTLAGVIGISSFNLQSTSPLEQSDIQNWANACLLKSRFAMIKGRVKFQGNALALPGKMVQLVGLGARFNGNALVSSVTHLVEGGNWYTTVDLGLSASWFSETTENIVSPFASGVLPGIAGLQNGVVKQIDSDPDNEFRVMVTIPMLNNKTVWARLSNLYATSGSGSYFYPEVGDEVVLGFFNEDPRFPVILGSLYSSSKAPPYTPDSKNETKAIVSKSKVKMIIDEEKKSYTIITPANNSIVLSDDAKSIVLSDQHGNKIEMSSSGITIESASDITIKANQNIKATATSEVNIAATSDLKISGLSVSGTAQTQMTMKGTAAAEFSASGDVIVKGAMVMIN